jgi:hypothetical protein
MTMKEKTSEKMSENNIRAEVTSVPTGDTDQENMTKIEKMTNYINERFGVHTNIFKSGGRWSVMLENHNIEGIKMKEIREYVISHSEELEEDEDI